jgi:uncharacterized protein YlzI (FlbEa/FlbD family)
MQRYIYLFAVALLLSSCSNKSQSILTAFKATEEGLIQSNETIASSSNLIYHVLDDRLSNPRTTAHAQIWQPKAMIVKEKSAEIINYIETLTKELKEEAGLKIKNGKEVFQEDNLDAVSRLFINKNKAEELHKKLQQYKKDILAVDPELYSQFGKNSIIITREFELDENIHKDFTKFFFDDVPVITALAMLRKFENNVRVLENEFVTYCYNRIGSTDGEGFFTKFSTIISQSANIIKAGDQLQIFAGVGAFSVVNNPVITINENVFKPDYKDAMALYKFKTPLKAGKYSIPVKIDYIEADGTKKTITNNVTYTVVE